MLERLEMRVFRRTAVSRQFETTRNNDNFYIKVSFKHLELYNDKQTEFGKLKNEISKWKV